MKEQVLLSPKTTFRVGGPARYFDEVINQEQIISAVKFAENNSLPVFILGGGSNVLVSDSGFDGMVIKPSMLGKKVLYEDSENIFIEVMAGEVLDDIVAWTVDNGWWGLENLSFVPGNMGAFVIQNVNAYGAKAEQVVHEVRVFDRNFSTIKVLNNSDCIFRYRTSIFNHEEKNRYIVLSITIKLKKYSDPILNYTDISNYFGGLVPSQKDLRLGVIDIRKKKGQDPNEYWSAGSFFNNLMLTQRELINLEKRVHDEFGALRAREIGEIAKRFSEQKEKDPEGGEGKVKIPTAFILDMLLGLKGTKKGGAMVSRLHALNILNTGDAKAVDILGLFSDIRKMVYKKLGVRIINEPELVGFSKEELDYYFDIT